VTGSIERLYNTTAQKRFYLPSKFVWGANCHKQAHELLADCGTVAVFVDQAFANHEIVTELKAALGARLQFTEVCRAMPQVQNLIEIATSQQPTDAVVSIGGGSTVDAAKAVVCHWIHGTFDGIGMGEKRGIAWLPGAKRPMLIGMPTTAGTGADASRYYVTYDAHTKGKVHGKSWDLVVDWVLVDPVFLKTAPADLMVTSAFDAFIHLFETFICRGEQSWLGDCLSLDGITRLLTALDRYITADDRSDETLLELNYAAAIGGVAISNIRTGNIHEAAGALLEVTPLTHAETLMVFLQPAYQQYQSAIAEREALLMRHLAAHAPHLPFKSFGDIIVWWKAQFDRYGMSQRIDSALAGVQDWKAASAHLLYRVISDRVWCEKESPMPLSDDMVDAFLKASLPNYQKA